MEGTDEKKSYSRVINEDASKNANIQKYLKEAIEKAEKDIDKIDDDIQSIMNND
ncbi:MAG: hypothetical protein PHX30_00395 [Candidatus Pacebacteria bacterium]|nr:hypothetical protein [Candidatus Paceibacterota bacterium]